MYSTTNVGKTLCDLFHPLIFSKTLTTSWIEFAGSGPCVLYFHHDVSHRTFYARRLKSLLQSFSVVDDPLNKHVVKTFCLASPMQPTNETEKRVGCWRKCNIYKIYALCNAKFKKSPGTFAKLSGNFWQILEVRIHPHAHGRSPMDATCPQRHLWIPINAK